MMGNQLLDPPKKSDILLRRAEIFAERFSQSLGAKKQGRAIILTFITDEKLPFDKEKYGKERIDKYAIQAYKTIFFGQDEIDLLLRDIRLVFSALFWDGQQLLELEFTYFMNDLLFLATADGE